VWTTFLSHSPEQTEALGESWGRAAESGWVIGLCGDLGAGKTQLVKGLARGLDIPGRVHSPTFALVNIYTGGRLPLAHLDLYRLDTPAQITTAGLEEYLQPAGVTVIEWAEKWLGERGGSKVEGRNSIEKQGPRHQHFTQKLRWVQIESLSETERRIVYEDLGD
jgi:tRNA threonylcarbamoyladenosine biosynthesis protein TsaE